METLEPGANSIARSAKCKGAIKQLSRISGTVSP